MRIGEEDVGPGKFKGVKERGSDEEIQRIGRRKKEVQLENFWVIERREDEVNARGSEIGGGHIKCEDMEEGRKKR